MIQWKQQPGGSADGTRIKKGLDSRKWITNEIKNCCLWTSHLLRLISERKKKITAEVKTYSLHRWGPSQSSRHLITAAENCRRALWRRQAGAADLCCRTGQTLVRLHAGQRLVADDGGQGAAQASQRRRLFFTWMKQRGVIQTWFRGHDKAGRDVPWWVQSATACLGPGLGRRERSKEGRERPRSTEACPRLWTLFLLGGEKICQTHADFETTLKSCHDTKYFDLTHTHTHYMD